MTPVTPVTPSTPVPAPVPRRTFLRTTGVLAVASAAAVLLPGCASPRPEFAGIFTEDFLGGGLSRWWRAHATVPRSDARITWDPALVEVRDSCLVLSATWDGTAGRAGAVTNWPVTRTYGRWEARIRAHPSPVFSYHLLLWPADDRWPPEIDIAEGFDAERSVTESFVHYRDPSGAPARQGFRMPVDATRWHDVAVEWTAGHVRFTCDGAAVGGTDGTTVPHTPMWLGIQVESHAGEGTGVVVDPPAPVLEVDRVRISAAPAGTPAAESTTGTTVPTSRTTNP